MGTLNPLEVFPLEVWKLIFENLEGQRGSSADLLSCSRTCVKFQDVLEPTKSQWLFETIFPFLIPYLGRRDILKCRSICKEWSRVIDTFVEDFELRRPFHEETSAMTQIISAEDKDSLREGKLKGVCFHSTRKITKFMEGMKNHGKNPFVGGSVCLEDKGIVLLPLHLDDELDVYELPDPDDGEDERYVFWNKASELLIMFGKHIKCIELKSNDFDELHVKKFYELLRQYLLFLPNLRSLTIKSIFIRFNDEASTYSEHGENSMRLHHLKKFLVSSTLPTISCLESLVLHGSGIPLPMCSKLINEINPGKFKRLKLAMLQFHEQGMDEDDIINLDEPMSRLTELHLSYMDSAHVLNQTLTNLVSPKAPLEKLVLDFPKVAENINFDTVCEIINRFGSTLKILALKGYVPVPSLKNLVAPHVRSLEVDGLVFGPDFLPACFAQSLEYLHISHHGVVDLFSLNELGRRIWNDMPNLKVIKLDVSGETIICTRQMHQHGVNHSSERVKDLWKCGQRRRRVNRLRTSRS